MENDASLSDSRKRILKVEETGDFYRKNTKPLIRLKGKWLVEAGILPNSLVRVENPKPGILIISLDNS